MGRNFTWPENGAGDRDAISLIWKTPSMYDALISAIMTRSKSPRPGNRNIGRETISLIWETPSILGFGNFGGEEWVAIPPDRTTDPMAGARFHSFGKRRRRTIRLLWE